MLHCLGDAASLTTDDRRAYRDKLLTIGLVHRQQAVREYRRGDGVRVKEETDDAGNITTRHNTGDTERVDVQIRPQTVVMQADQESGT